MDKLKSCECILCGKSVKEHITALLLITEWEKPEDEQETQQFFCHLECFKTAMNKPNYLYIGEE